MGLREIQGGTDGELAFAEMVGLFAGFDEAGAIGGNELYAVLNHGKGEMWAGRQGQCGFFDAKNAVIRENSLITLFGNQGQGFIEGKFF